MTSLEPIALTGGKPRGGEEGGGQAVIAALARAGSGAGAGAAMLGAGWRLLAAPRTAEVTLTRSRAQHAFPAHFI